MRVPQGLPYIVQGLESLSKEGKEGDSGCDFFTYKVFKAIVWSEEAALPCRCVWEEPLMFRPSRHKFGYSSPFFWDGNVGQLQIILHSQHLKTISLEWCNFDFRRASPNSPTWGSWYSSSPSYIFIAAELIHGVPYVQIQWFGNFLGASTGLSHLW